MDRFRKIPTKTGEVDYISRSVITQGSLSIALGTSLLRISVHYKGEGNQVVVRFDPNRQSITCTQVVDGYSHCIFGRAIDTKELKELSISFGEDWIDCRVDKHYLGNTFLSRKCHGRVRLNQAASAAVSVDVDYFEFSPDTLFLGDGFTGGNWPHVDYWMYPERLLGSDTAFLNAGIPAANTEDVLNVLDHFVSKNARFINAVVMTGVDDVIDGLSSETTRKNLCAICEGLSQVADNPIICTLTPRRDSLQEKIDSVNSFIRELPESFGIRIADVAAIFKDESHKICLSMGDFPNTNGQQLISDALRSIWPTPLNESELLRLREKPLVSSAVFRLSQKVQGLSARLKF